MHPYGLSGWSWTTDFVTPCAGMKRKARYWGQFSWSTETVKGRMEVKRGMEMSHHRKVVPSVCVVPSAQVPASPQVMSCCFIDGRFCGREAVICGISGGTAAEIKHIPAENDVHWIIIDNVTVEKPSVFVCFLLGMFKMHLLVMSYKYRIQLLSNLLYKVEGFCINTL